ncbi:MAG TPA: hypothetical protein VK112_01465 [Fodinibius sp.]|nr:hypothetical protein [Fodinibius sp.]
MPEPMAELARWIDDTYQIPVLNVRLERTKSSNLPRLNVIFEYDKDYAGLRDEFTNIKPAVEENIKETCRRLFAAEEDLTGLFIIFSAFAPVARAEANGAIPQDEIDALQQELALDELWKISRNFGATDFMLYTDKQVERFKANGIDDRLSGAYFDILKPHDEFDYFNRETFAVHLDSKETFDQNYDSSWQWYWNDH